MANETDFEVLVASLAGYERLVAEVYCDGKIVALVNQERGLGLFEVETPGIGLVEATINRRVDLNGFLGAIETARQRLRVGKF